MSLTHFAHVEPAVQKLGLGSEEVAGCRSTRQFTVVHPGHLSHVSRSPLVGSAGMYQCQPYLVILGNELVIIKFINLL